MLNRSITCLLVTLLIVTTIKSRAQDPTSLPDPTTLVIDFKTFNGSGPIPYSKSFGVWITNLDPAVVAKVTWELKTGRDAKKGDLIDEGSVDLSTTTAILPIEAILDPNRSYYFKFDFFKTDGSNVRASAYYGFTTRTKLGDYIKLDLGVRYAFKTSNVLSHTTVHFYFVPLGNDADISEVKHFGKKLLVRTSLFGGISPVSLYSNTKQPIVNSTGIGNLIYGVGIRSPFYGWTNRPRVDRNIGWVFLQPLRINIGEVYFKQDDANPLITKNKDKHAFYLGFSYDVNIVGLLGPIGKLLKP